MKQCTCTSSIITRYQKRISGPLLDRIDIHVEVPAWSTRSCRTTAADLAGSERIEAAHLAEATAMMGQGLYVFARLQRVQRDESQK